MLISELTEDQRDYLFWRLEKKSGLHPVLAYKVANGEISNFFREGRMSVKEAFLFADCNEHSAKIQAKKVITYRKSEYLKRMK